MLKKCCYFISNLLIINSNVNNVDFYSELEWKLKI